jgi:hemolysin activation/secretion protein
MKHASPNMPLLAAFLLPLLLAFPPLLVDAAAQVMPGAGSILQQIAPNKPALPSPSGTGLTVEREAGASMPPSAPFRVERIDIDGNTLFETGTLHALVAPAEGTSLTLAELDLQVGRITDYYRSRGYFLARAIIPAQAISAGIVRVQVLEARYGQIRLDNSSRVKDGLLQDGLAALQGGQAIEQARLDHVLLLLSDLPGAVLSATLKPGDAIGSADLLVQAGATAAVSGNVVFDNAGNDYTGRARVAASANLIGALRQGDVLGVTALSTGRAMNYGRLAYEFALNGAGTRAGGSQSTLHYTLGGALASLDAHGTADVTSLWLRHPLLRTRDFNLYGQVQFDRLQLRDHIDASALSIDRHLDNWSASLGGDARDKLLPDSITSWNLTATAGRLGFDDASAQSSDAQTARTEGRFLKWNANLAHVQGLDARTALYVALAGQWSNANLDASGKMLAGGPTSVRGYDIAALAGDIGYVGNVELRRDLDANWHGQWQGIAFIEHAHLTINQTRWTNGAGGTNGASLSGAGAGLNWSGFDQWSARLGIAAPVGATPPGINRKARAWLDIAKGF